MFQTAVEVALNAKIEELQREIYCLKKDLYGDGLDGGPDRFLGHPVTTMDLRPNHPPTMELERAASWQVTSNHYGIPIMIGRTYSSSDRHVETTLYCKPLPNEKSDQVNVLGELHMRCLKMLARTYSKEDSPR